MRVIAVPPLREFWNRHADAEEPLRAWLADAQKAGWQTPHDLKTDYGNASILGNDHVVFNIKDNDHRLIVVVSLLRLSSSSSSAPTLSITRWMPRPWNWNDAS